MTFHVRGPAAEAAAHTGGRWGAVGTGSPAGWPGCASELLPPSAGTAPGEDGMQGETWVRMQWPSGPG